MLKPLDSKSVSSRDATGDMSSVKLDEAEDQGVIDMLNFVKDVEGGSFMLKLRVMRVVVEAENISNRSLCSGV